ncbi:unnamed protein product [Phaedon cochleariae]|uniref:Uncharacterized protein n=1 Tax=Phaedon cochleariae TaxID=80249 RepID=A0A9N9SAN3_PHACE|nr:unnamed protein product [Phaedon cochleariae]
MKNDKTEKRSFIKSVRNYFREYCTCTSIHGFKYFGEKRTYFERFWWFIVFGCTLAVCIFTITIVYQRWLQSPIIVSFATRDTPIYSIPFPAVTICSESKSIQSKYSHMGVARKLFLNENLTEEEQYLEDYVESVCDTKLWTGSTKPYLPDFIETMENISESLHIISCSFMNEQSCSALFKPIITDEGFCYTFNMLDRSEIYNEKVVHHSYYHAMGNLTYENWTVENGFASDAGINPYPRRALMAGVNHGLTVHLKTIRANIDHICKLSLQGYRVSVHLPSRVPSLRQEYFRVPLDQAVLAVVNPSMITTSETVRYYSPARRECYFSTERSLKYFKTYTNKNCLLECLTNYTLKHCGCVAHYMPRDNETEICGPGNTPCMSAAEEDYQLYDLRKKIGVGGNETTRIEHLDDCDCMPMCSDLSYNVDISQSDWKFWEVEARLLGSDTNLSSDGLHVSKLTIFFKSSHFITTQRHEFYGPTDFLANFGGLLGLFTGVSVLSVMEAIYFLTVRICCNTRLYGYWAGPQQL